MPPRTPAASNPRFASRIDVDLTPNALAQALAARRGAGARVLDLTASNPTRAGFTYPEAEILAALAAPEALRYEPEPRGLLAARTAVSAYYAARSERVDAEDVLITSSTSESYALLMKLLAEPGDEFLVPAPSYPLFEMLAGLEAVSLVRYPLEPTPGSGWRIGREALARAISPRTRAVVVVHPNNPTGSLTRLGVHPARLQRATPGTAEVGDARDTPRDPGPDPLVVRGDEERHD